MAVGDSTVDLKLVFGASNNDSEVLVTRADGK